MKTSPNDVSNQEILEALNSFAGSVDERFDRVEGEISGIKNEISEMKGEIAGIKGEVSDIKGEIASIKSVMVTRDYLDQKLSDLRFAPVLSSIQKR